MRSSNRDLSFDIMRIIACLMVISLHIPIDSLFADWTWSRTVFVVWLCLAKCAVPIFFMLSGAFSRNYDMKKTLKKVFYMFVLFVVYKILYACWDCIYFGGKITWNQLYYERGITNLRTYAFHLWYLPEYIFVVLISPIINAAEKTNRKIPYYIAIIFLIYSIVMPSAKPISLFGGTMVINPIQAILETLSVSITQGVGYYCIGKSIYSIAMNKKELINKHKGLLPVSVFAFVITNIYTTYVTIRNSIPNRSMDVSILNWNNYNIVLSATLMFTVFALISARGGNGDSIVVRSGVITNLVEKITPYILYIYLIHVFFIEALTMLGFNAYSFSLFLAVPIKVVVVFILSLLYSIIVVAMHNGLKRMVLRKA